MDESKVHGNRVAGQTRPGPLANISFRSRLTAALVFTALAPLLTFGVLVVLFYMTLPASQSGGLVEILFFTLLGLALLCVPLALLLVAELLRPLRRVAQTLERVSAGELSEAPVVPGDDEVARLAQGHGRLATDLRRRSAQVGRLLEAIGELSQEADVDGLVRRAGAEATRAFDLIDATVHVGNAAAVPDPEVIPGEPRPLRALLLIGDEALGVLRGWLPATRAWSPADQDLFELYASEVAVALRNAQLLARVEAQKAQLIKLDEAKDEFLRGVSHNLQSPLTSIRAHAEQLGRDRPDRRLEIIAEQSDRLSRIVRQLLTVSRLATGAIKPRSEVISLAPRARRAWEALAAPDIDFELSDGSDGWLAIADPDQLDQVLWALLDNAVNYGKGRPVSVTISPDAGDSRLRLTISDGGPGISDEDRARMFGRFARGRLASEEGGSGLGLYVSRELCRAMGGELELAPPSPGGGASFQILLPADRADEA